MKKLIIFLLLALLSYATELTINSKLQTFSLPDQFNNKQTVNNNIKMIIFSSQKDTSQEINEFLATKEPDFLEKHHAVFISNISAMPAFVTRMFALPKLRNYKHKILLIYDDNDNRFIFKNGSSTLYKLEDGVIRKIQFIHKKDLEQAFKGTSDTKDNLE